MSPDLDVLLPRRVLPQPPEYLPILKAEEVQQFLKAAPDGYKAAPGATAPWVAETDVLLAGLSRVEQSLAIVLDSTAPLHIYGYETLTEARTLVYPAAEGFWWTVCIQADGRYCRSWDSVRSEEVPACLIRHGVTAHLWRVTSCPRFSIHPFGPHGAPEGAMDRRDVYFLQGSRTGNIKIGITNDLGRRIAQLTNASSEALHLVGMISNGGRATEKAWHDAFAEDRLHGEWFMDSPDLLDAIAELRAGYAADEIPA